MTIRQAIPKNVETTVLIACKRRCCLCFYLDGYEGIKKGQLAHLNKRPDDNRLENLVWLCLDHHDSFDSTTSQSKNFTRAEVIRWRDQLHDHFANISSGSQIKATADDLLERPSTPKAWRNPWVAKSDSPQLFPYRSSNGFDGVCVIERIPISDGRIVIACVATPGNPGNSITNTVETIFEQVCLHFEIDPAKVVWLENYEYINPAEWLHVVFSQVPPDGWGEPEWKTMSPAKWDELGLRPVARMKTNHGELISKLRKFSPASQTSD